VEDALGAEAESETERCGIRGFPLQPLAVNSQKEIFDDLIDAYQGSLDVVKLKSWDQVL